MKSARKWSGFVVSFLSLFHLSCGSLRTFEYSKDLTLIPISPSVFIHETYLQTNSFGRVECNGLVYINGNEAIILDTPAEDSVSEQLLNWLATEYPGVKVKAVIIDHFHNDCLGGLKTFHSRGIPSYSYQTTPSLVKDQEKPNHTFTDSLVLTVGGKRIVSYYPGEAHTRDNIVTYITEESVLFGGCMVKAIGANKGFVDDGNVDQWPATIAKVKERFRGATIIVPGHGEHGGRELLDYTIDLFSKK